jgi:erythritol kinase
MSADVLIGIDAGTSVIKSVAFTIAGEQLAVAAIPNSYETLADGGVEQDMARTWRDTAETLRQLAQKVPRLAERTLAVAVTGQGDGIWLVDKAGEPVAPAWLWLDSRAASIAEAYVKSPRYAEHYKRSGTGLNACQASAQLAWMQKNRPEMLARAAHSLHCKDWLFLRLTGVAATDPSEANFTFGDFRTRQYAPAILDELGAGEAKRLLPPIIDGVQQSVPLSAEAARQTGLKAGTPVNLGYVDVICTGVGGGLYDPEGRTGCTIVGSTGMHMRLAPWARDVRLNDKMSGYSMAFPVPGMVAMIQSNMASTINIDWLLDMARGILMEQGVERSRSDLLKGIDERILARPAGALLYHPYISRAGERGPFLDPAARASFVGLDTGHDFNSLMRGVFEGLGYAARDCYAAMGPVPSEVRITGGAARSQALRLILASVLGASVRTVNREEAGAAGAAMIAAVQHKVHAGMDDCASAWVDPLLGPVTQPDAGLSAIYDRNFALYQQVREALPGVWRGLAERPRGA